MMLVTRVIQVPNVYKYRFCYVFILLSMIIFFVVYLNNKPLVVPAPGPIPVRISQPVAVSTSVTVPIPEPAAVLVPSEPVVHQSVQETEEEFHNRLKYILLWTNNLEPLSTFLQGQDAFYKYECPVKNCYVTNNRNFFGGNLSNFDAVMFNGRSLSNNVNTYPKERYPHQKYVYTNLETANIRICCSFLDGFFNWTATYKFNSDVVMKYYTILDKETKESVGPKADMHWVQNMKEVDKDFAKSLKSKTKAAAWLVNNCGSQERNKFVKNLQEELKKFNLTVDVYGHCGPYKCPRQKHSECAALIKRHYFFYMALENSFYEDYVTEKILHAVLNNAVPIVFGGANYSRFLPPGSYLNGREHNAEELAAIMNLLIKNPYLYQQYFRWRNHYEFVSAMPEDLSGDLRLFNATKHEGEGICNFCAAMNDKKKFETFTVYEHIRSWWHGTDI